MGSHLADLTLFPLSPPLASSYSFSDLLASYPQVTEPGSGGRYEVQRRLEQGGEGVIYHCRDRQKQIPVAVKILHPHWAQSVDAAYRFSREAAVLRDLDHPFIVRFHDGPLGFYDSSSKRMCPAFALEYLEGKDLFCLSLIRDVFRASPGILGTFVVHTALALHYLHDHGFVHRDIKRENFFIKGWKEYYSYNCRAVLLDFGLVGKIGEPTQEDYQRDRFFLPEVLLQGEIPRLSDEVRRLTHPGTPFGNDYCRSPEQDAGFQLDGRADLFSLGVALYIIIEKDFPYPSFFNRSSRKTPVLRQPKQGDHPLIPLVLRLLELRPGDRYQTGLEVAHDVVRRLPRSQRHMIRQNLLHHSRPLMNAVFG